MGETGRGLAEALGIEDEIDFVTGTFSKSLGSVGGFFASRKHDVAPLRSQIRAYMFTASSTPSVIASTRAALKRVAQGQELRSQLWKNCQRVHEGLTSSVQARRSAEPGHRQPHGRPGASRGGLAGPFDAGVYVNLVVPPGLEKS